MKKIDSLRELLLRAVPPLRADPTKLAIFVDQGRVAARAGASLSFEYRYKLNIVVQDYAGDRDAVIFPVLAWIAQHQPDLLERSTGEPIAFEAEILDAETTDLSITLDLTERVIVEPRPDGGYDLRHLDDVADDDRFGGLCGVNLLRLVLGTDVIAQSEAWPA
jgi:hypothetical protein